MDPRPRPSSGRSGRTRLRTMFGLALVGVVAGLATAMATGVVVDTGSVAVPAGCTGSPNPSRADATYDATNLYRVSSVHLTSVGIACRNLPYTLTVANNISTFAQLAEWSGTTVNGSSGDQPAPTTAAGADVNDVNTTTNQVRVYFLTSTS